MIIVGLDLIERYITACALALGLLIAEERRLATVLAMSSDDWAA